LGPRKLDIAKIPRADRVCVERAKAGESIKNIPKREPNFGGAGWTELSQTNTTPSGVQATTREMLARGPAAAASKKIPLPPRETACDKKFQVPNR